MQYPIYYMKYIGYCIGRIYVRKAPKKFLIPGTFFPKIVWGLPIKSQEIRSQEIKS